MDMKKFYTSKTVWVNVLAIIGVFASTQFGYDIDADKVAFGLGIINLILRKITKQPIVW